MGHKFYDEVEIKDGLRINAVKGFVKEEDGYDEPILVEKNAAITMDEAIDIANNINDLCICTNNIVLNSFAEVNSRTNEYIKSKGLTSYSFYMEGDHNYSKDVFYKLALKFKFNLINNAENFFELEGRYRLNDGAYSKFSTISVIKTTDKDKTASTQDKISNINRILTSNMLFYYSSKEEKILIPSDFISLSSYTGKITIEAKIKVVYHSNDNCSVTLNNCVIKDIPNDSNCNIIQLIDTGSTEILVNVPSTTSSETTVYEKTITVSLPYYCVLNSDKTSTEDLVCNDITLNSDGYIPLWRE